MMTTKAMTDLGSNELGEGGEGRDDYDCRKRQGSLGLVWGRLPSGLRLESRHLCWHLLPIPNQWMELEKGYYNNPKGENK